MSAPPKEEATEATYPQIPPPLPLAAYQGPPAYPPNEGPQPTSNQSIYPPPNILPQPPYSPEARPIVYVAKNTCSVWDAARHK